MRWDALFSDYEAQMNAARDDNWRAEVADRTRGERAAVELAARIGEARGVTLSLTLVNGDTVTGHVEDSAPLWVLLRDEASRNHLVPMSAVAVVRGATAKARPLSEVERRLDLTHVLRALSRDRARVQVRVPRGDVNGIIAAVHADHIEVAEQPRGRASVPVAHIIEVVSH